LQTTIVVALRSAVSSATARNHQRVKSAGGWPRAIPMPRCQTAGAGDASSRNLVSENFKKIQRPKTVCKLQLPVSNNITDFHSLTSTLYCTTKLQNLLRWIYYNLQFLRETSSRFVLTCVFNGIKMSDKYY